MAQQNQVSLIILDLNTKYLHLLDSQTYGN